MAPPPRFFFVRPLKTGGTTLTWYARAQFGMRRVYPNAEDVAAIGYGAPFDVDYLTSIPGRRRRRFRFIGGHLPAATLDVLPATFVTLTMLRDPFDRTVSFLRDRRRTVEALADHSLEQLYDEPETFGALENHQTKMLGLHVDQLGTYVGEAPPADQACLDRALARLDTIDLVGVHERYDAVVEALQQRYGWDAMEVPDRRVGTERDPIEASLRRRIAADNRFDIELYERAREMAEG